MTRIRFALMAGVLLALPACAPGDGGTDETAPDTTTASEADVRAELTSRMRAYGEALVAGDPEALLGFWTDDAHMREPGIDADRAELEAFLREGFGSGLQIAHFEARPADVFIHGDVAYEVGSYDERIIPPEATEPLSVSNHYFLRWERGEDGLWRFDRLVAGAREEPAGPEPATQ